MLSLSLILKNSTHSYLRSPLNCVQYMLVRSDVGHTLKHQPNGTADWISKLTWWCDLHLLNRHQRDSQKCKMDSLFSLLYLPEKMEYVYHEKYGEPAEESGAEQQMWIVGSVTGKRNSSHIVMEPSNCTENTWPPRNLFAPPGARHQHWWNLNDCILYKFAYFEWLQV